MQQYKVFDLSGATDVIKLGWSWPGFFFGATWAIVKKMWLLGIGILVGFILFGLILESVGGPMSRDLATAIALIIERVIFGAYGNHWREKKLIARGYLLAGTVEAANPEDAVARYFNTANAER